MAEIPVEIPDKIFFSIGEVSKLTGLKPHVIRYWETEFPVLKPQKRRDGRRVYRRPDVELILKIKTLLYRDKYTIAGARRRLAGRGKDRNEAAATLALIEELKRELLKIAAELNDRLNA